ncbi:MAG: hypothetical protein WAN35_21955, partial [Terracidiphilus sp.]
GESAVLTANTGDFTSFNAAYALCSLPYCPDHRSGRPLPGDIDFCALLPWSRSEFLDPASNDHASGRPNLREMLSTRIIKADMLANFRVQRDFHRHYHFTPRDLEG